MTCIDEIMDLLKNDNLNNIIKGVNLATNITDLSLLIQPYSEGKYGKNVWEECSIILVKKSDEELKSYLLQLLRWLQDLNWPGAMNVFYRLFAFSSELLIDPLKICIDESLNNNDINWLSYISGLIKNPSIEILLDNNYSAVLKNNLNNFWNNTIDNDKQDMEEFIKVSKIADLESLINPNKTANIWQNFAIILYKKNDEELKPYLMQLLECIKNLNTMGNEIIFYRLNKFSGDLLSSDLNKSLKIALQQGNEEWKNNLKRLTNNPEICININLLISNKPHHDLEMDL